MFAKSFKSAVVLKAEEKLSFDAFKEVTDYNFIYAPAGDYDLSTIGLIPFEDEDENVKEFGDMQIIKIGRSSKKVNKKKVKRILKERIADLSQKHYSENPDSKFSLSKDEKQLLEEQIVHSLLPETEVDEFENHVILDFTNNLVYITNVSKKLSEDITQFIRTVTETFAVVPVMDNELDIIEGFASMMEEIETRFDLGSYVKLEDSEGVVTWTKESLYDTSVPDLMQTGKQITSIGLTYDGILPVIVDVDFLLKGFKWPKEFKEEGSFESHVLLCITEVRGLVKDLIQEFTKE